MSLVSLLLTTAPGASIERYDGHRVAEATPANEAQLDALIELTDDVWTEHIRDKVTFRVAPDRFAHLNATGIGYTIVHEDLQGVLDAERDRIAQHELQVKTGERASDALLEYRELADYWAQVEMLAEHIAPKVDHHNQVFRLEGRYTYELYFAPEANGAKTP